MRLKHIIPLLALAAGLTLASCEKKKAPEISNQTARELSPTVILVEADITGQDLSEFGVCLSTSLQEPTKGNGQISEGSLDGDHFQARIFVMEPGKTCYLRVFATNDQGTTYSPTMKLTISYLDVNAGDNGYPSIGQ
ncbi:MAG: hypothetical protein IJ154_01270 [Bacteroidales bacterium]|nr:hypothetical protein [Bacteroidales bacterium]